MNRVGKCSGDLLLHRSTAAAHSCAAQHRRAYNSQLVQQVPHIWSGHHHHHHVTQSSHSINAIGPAPLWSGRKRCCTFGLVTLLHGWFFILL
jgi:hypothetical protein